MGPTYARKIKQVKTQNIDFSIETPKRIGLTIFFVIFGLFWMWAALAPIDGSALAPGQVTVKSYKKTVQHL